MQGNTFQLVLCDFGLDRSGWEEGGRMTTGQEQTEVMEIFGWPMFPWDMSGLLSYGMWVAEKGKGMVRVLSKIKWKENVSYMYENWSFASGNFTG